MASVRCRPRPPPFADFVAFLEALGPAADRMLANPEEVDLVRQFPELAQVAVRPLRLGPAEVPARVYRHPAPSAGSALVWVHGGAYVSGNLDMHESHWVALALAARGIPVLALVEHSAEALGVAPDALHLGGGSAGGNLAASVTRCLIEEGAPALRSLVLAYATVHARVTEWEVCRSGGRTGGHARSVLRAGLDRGQEHPLRGPDEHT
ncbi:alpha/beta hydrolase [Streptomyces umbrinus]|uniref:alpha/beta hydrolase n=1 Tax=Streptomyces umbrinus TaxID=67370 RepID=UPI003435813C